MSDYICEVCEGKGRLPIMYEDSGFYGKCPACHGTGQKQITISLEEYDRLKLAEKRMRKLEEMSPITTNPCDVHCPSHVGLEDDCSLNCFSCRAKAVLSYGKEDGEK